jgi:hypothetical protein
LGKKGLLLTLIIIIVIIGIYGLTQILLNQSLTTYIVIVIGTIAIAEIIYWQDPQKPTAKQNLYGFTAKVKLETYLDVAFGWTIVGATIYTVKSAVENSQALVDAVVNYGIYPLIVIAIIGAVAGYVLLNSLKYRKHTKKPIQFISKQGEKE